MRILIYSNCQGFAIKETLMIDPGLASVLYVPCWSTDITKEKFTQLIKESDVIITQPISDSYRNEDYLSTTYIIETASPTCKILIFNSCRFNFYYFDLTYKCLHGSIFKEPHDYHYNGILETYRNKLQIENYIEKYVNNISLKQPAELETIANDSIHELKRRNIATHEKYGSYRNVTILSVHDFIKDNYKQKLLFYSMNHPTKLLIQYLSEEIAKLIPIKCTINYTVDELSEYRSILYKCIQPVVTFNINDYAPHAFGTSSVKDIVQHYYTAYDKVGYDLINQVKDRPLPMNL
jgi:predicted HTH domain antitoxin